MNFSDPDRGLSRAGSVMSAAMLDSESAFIGTCFTSWYFEELSRRLHKAEVCKVKACTVDYA